MKILITLLMVSILFGCSDQAAAESPQAAAVSSVQEEEIEQKEEYPMHIQPGEETFSFRPLPENVIAKITGKSWVENDRVKLEDLSLLTVSYKNFEGQAYTGQMISAASLAPELCEIFHELYEAQFPIEKIRLIDDYDADDTRSMADNNSSAFCYRVISGTEYLSNHSYGTAVDINPVQNPYLHGDIVDPLSGAEYLDRENIRPGMISRGDVCYNAFISRGWTWGGEWTGSTIDYQHFEKQVQE